MVGKAEWYFGLVWDRFIVVVWARVLGVFFFVEKNHKVFVRGSFLERAKEITLIKRDHKYVYGYKQTKGYENVNVFKRECFSLKISQFGRISI